VMARVCRPVRGFRRIPADLGALRRRFAYNPPMTTESSQLLAAALKHVPLANTFCPIEIGRKAGLSKPQAQLAARALSNHGILSLGFDLAAAFTPDYRKANAKTLPKGVLRRKVASK
jgi:hypothetical protein